MESSKDPYLTFSLLLRNLGSQLRCSSKSDMLVAKAAQESR
jgi:hypothetical protein